MFKSIKTKMLVFQLGLVVFMSLVFGITGYFLMVNSLMSSQRKNLEFIAQEQAAHIKYEIENIEEKALEITIEYLKLYTKLWADVQPADPGYMELLNDRKRIMLETMLENDPGEFWLKQSLPQETAHRIMALLF